MLCEIGTDVRVTYQHLIPVPGINQDKREITSIPIPILNMYIGSVSQYLPLVAIEILKIQHAARARFGVNR